MVQDRWSAHVSGSYSIKEDEGPSRRLHSQDGSFDAKEDAGEKKSVSGESSRPRGGLKVRYRTQKEIDNLRAVSPDTLTPNRDLRIEEE